MSGDLLAVHGFINLQSQVLFMAFNFFGKKENHRPAGHFTDRTYMSTAAKMNACLQLVKDEPNTLFICWFRETTGHLKEFFNQHGIPESCITEARFVHSPMLQYKTAVFAEHHPLHSKELELVKNWEQKEIVVYSAMDEPLFKHFGSEKMLSVMKLLGMKESEVIEHSLVTKSIIKGQDKISKLVSLEQPANSQGEWMEKNIK